MHLMKGFVLCLVIYCYILGHYRFYQSHGGVQEMEWKIGVTLVNFMLHTLQ